MSKKNLVQAQQYADMLNQIKKDIQQSQLRAAAAVNKELILLYWRIGKVLTNKIDQEGWGAS